MCWILPFCHWDGCWQGAAQANWVKLMYCPLAVGGSGAVCTRPSIKLRRGTQQINRGRFACKRAWWLGVVGSGRGGHFRLDLGLSGHTGQLTRGTNPPAPALPNNNFYTNTCETVTHNTKPTYNATTTEKNNYDNNNSHTRPNINNNDKHTKENNANLLETRWVP